MKVPIPAAVWTGTWEPGKRLQRAATLGRTGGGDCRVGWRKELAAGGTPPIHWEKLSTREKIKHNCAGRELQPVHPGWIRGTVPSRGASGHAHSKRRSGRTTVERLLPPPRRRSSAVLNGRMAAGKAPGPVGCAVDLGPQEAEGGPILDGASGAGRGGNRNSRKKDN